jgi:molybdopterin converting factor small subunit
MKIAVEFLSLPNLAKMAGGKTITVDFSGRTAGDLLHELASKYGAGFRKFLFDESGRLDMSLAMTVNKEWVRQNQMDKALQEGDRVSIMMLVAGG